MQIARNAVTTVMIAAGLWLYTPATPAQQQEDRGCEFVRTALEARDAMHVGDTRAKLQRAFRLSGGMSAADQSRYVYSKCSYLYVEVTFHVVHSNDPLGSPNDTIASISNLSVDYEPMN